MCNCSNFVGDDDYGMELEGSHHINADGNFEHDSGEFFGEDDMDYASGANMGDMNLGFGDDLGFETGDPTFDNFVESEAMEADGFFPSDMSDFDGDVENGDDFDYFLTKRMRGRRKLRKTLRKEGGMTRKEARKAALSAIPKQNLIKTTMNAIKGKTSPETQALIDQGLLSTNKNVLAAQISEAVKENEAEGTQAGAGGADIEDVVAGAATTPSGAGLGDGTPKKGGTGTMMWVGVGAVVLVAGYFMFGKKLGLRG